MGADPRLKGQEMSIRVVQDSNVLQQIDSVASFNDAVKFEIKEDGFLGEVVNRFDSVLNGYTGDLEFQVHDATWLAFEQAVEAKVTRQTPGTVFNVVRTDFFANGSSAVIVYSDVSWGEFGTSAGSRADFIKVKAPFGTSDRSVQINQV